MTVVPGDPRAPEVERYYAGLVGAWEGTLALEVTRPDAPWSRRVLGALFRVGPRMRTTLARGEGGAWRHTTEVVWAGLRFFGSEETIAPGPDGLEMVGVQRFLGGGGGPYRAPVAISADAGGAAYGLAWLGEPMVQRTRIVPEGLALTQETSWSRVTTTLRRR